MAKQFQALESALNLPSLANDDDDQDADQTPVPDVEQEANDDMLAVLDHAKNLTRMSKEANGLTKHDVEMDELAGLAVTAHKDLMELGMNVELRHAGEILSTAGTMLKIAVDAKNNKVEKLLRAMKLELDKRKVDAQIAQMDPAEAPIESTATKLDFNELLRMSKEHK